MPRAAFLKAAIVKNKIKKKEKEICAGPMAMCFKYGRSSTPQKRGYNSKKRSFRRGLWSRV